MARRVMTVVRFEEIQRLIAQGLSDRAVARALRCRRDKVAEIREGRAVSPAVPKVFAAPLWTESVPWLEVTHELSMGHPLKFIWEEKAQSLTTYSNFWKQFYRRYPEHLKASITLRQFEPGERCEVDWAGDAIEWTDLKYGEIRKAYVFVAALGFSQLGFAWASDDMKSPAWLSAHRRMYEAFSGVPHVTVPDCLKAGVAKCHRYDPDLNPAYADLAAHYGTAVVPARPLHPKDKAIAEGWVKILMRYFRFRMRKRRFSSLAEINVALAECVDRINRKPHTRFRISRLTRFEERERAALKPLPAHAHEAIEWKKAKLHPDCHVGVESALYSAPHRLRGKELRIKLTEHQVEIFHQLERVAVHPRDRHRLGNRVTTASHLPPNSQAFVEATPQNLLSQSRFIGPALNALILELFEKDTLGNIRRAQGLIRVSTIEINETGRDQAMPRIEEAIAQMRRFNRVRVPYFQEQLKHLRKRVHTESQAAAREIVRLPDNPMLRYASPEQRDFFQPGSQPTATHAAAVESSQK